MWGQLGWGHIYQDFCRAKADKFKFWGGLKPIEIIIKNRSGNSNKIFELYSLHSYSFILYKHAFSFC